MRAIAAHIAVNLEESIGPAIRWADLFHPADERIVSSERHALQAIAESEERDRSARLHIDAKAIHERVGAGGLNKLDHLRHREPQTFHIPISKVRVPGLLRRLLESEFRKVRPPQCFEPFGGATEQARHLSGKNVVAYQPANVAKQCEGSVRGRVAGLSKTCTDDTFEHARSQT